MNILKKFSGKIMRRPPEYGRGGIPEQSPGFRTSPFQQIFTRPPKCLAIAIALCQSLKNTKLSKKPVMEKSLEHFLLPPVSGSLMIVEPINPPQGDRLHFIDIASGATMPHDSGPEKAIDGFGHGIFIRTAGVASRSIKSL